MLGKQLSRFAMRNIAGGNAAARPCPFIIDSCNDCPMWCLCDDLALLCIG
ncbi:hypothetical protein LX64_01340 [Chitinophaga skermanii]|uniref:Uncharacterized protein n=1 Tax=Chitinophaga skermanii TaxID=331697 RepID=A0A327QVI4_9BACT|nr:hypothetical protein LX64_01340 [Chitinophaga skermanii]